MNLLTIWVAIYYLVYLGNTPCARAASPLNEIVVDIWHCQTINSGSRRWSWWCYWHPGRKQCFSWLQGKHWSHWSLSVILSINCPSLIIPRMFYSNLRSWKDLTIKFTTNWITHPEMRHHIHPQHHRHIIYAHTFWSLLFLTSAFRS